jgi:hypothetical protein
MPEHDLPPIEPGRGRLVYDKDSRTIKHSGPEAATTSAPYLAIAKESRKILATLRADMGWLINRAYRAGRADGIRQVTRGCAACLSVGPGPHTCPA